MGCEGIVSKRLGSLYVSGRTPHWLEFKNPAVAGGEARGGGGLGKAEPSHTSWLASVSWGAE